MKTLIFLCSALITAAALSAQTTINVPDALHPTIQSGIDSAKNGDIVLVAENHYYGQVRFNGKKITLASQFFIDGNPVHIANTIIDGDSVADTDSASVVYFRGTCDTNSVLCGFTIQRGKGTHTADNFDYRQGGGIWISRCGAKIIHNRIIDNTLDDTAIYGGQSVAGGGIGAYLENSSHTIVIRDNLIDKNNCISWYQYASGGGISISCPALIENNIITNNICLSYQVASSYGGGISCIQDYSWPCPVSVTIRNNSISNNLVRSQGKWANGAGVKIQSVKVLFTGNTVSGNTVYVGSFVSTNDGFAGVMLQKPDHGCIISGNTFSENFSDHNAGGLGLYALPGDPAPESVHVENNYFIGNYGGKGGGFSTMGNPVTMVNNIFSGNHALSDGGAVYLSGKVIAGIHHLAVIINNSFSGNVAGDNGGAICSYKSEPLVFNSILYDDTASGLNQEIFLQTGFDTIEVASSMIDFSLLKGGYLIDGGSNLSGDPQFTNPVWLSTDETCPGYNAGVPSFTCMCGEDHNAPSKDIKGTPRPWYSEYDMGAYEFEAPVGILENAGVQSGLICKAYPNPFKESVTVSISLPETAQVVMLLMNGMGQTVAMPVNRVMGKGEHVVQWNSGTLPAGIYYYRISANENINSGKICKY